MPPKVANKRQYSIVDVGADNGSSTSEGTTRAAPKRKKSAIKNTPTKKALAAKGPTVNELYRDSVKAIEAHLKVLDGKVRRMSPNSRAISTDTYAEKSLKFLKPVKELGDMGGGLVPAFNLAMYVADASHTDCDTTVNMSREITSARYSLCFPPLLCHRVRS